MKAHFIDFDSLVTFDSKAWIVDKSNPSIPIMKLSQSDFNLIRSGVYRNQNNKLEFNGETFWLPLKMFNVLKVKVKNTKSNLANLGISLQEFFNRDIIDHMEFKIDPFIVSLMKNTTDDIYLICSRKTKSAYKNVMEKVQEQLKEEGLAIKNLYYISETFYNQKSDEVTHKKIRLLIQHLVGYKTEVDKFIDEEIDRYDEIEYYDNQIYTDKLTVNVNHFLNLIYQKTENGLKSVIKEDVLYYKPTLIVNYITGNGANPIITKAIDLHIDNVIRAFESFSRM